MDPVGFGVGVVGLAGLISTCIECFHIIQCMRTFGRDAELLVTKFDIERDLLTQWAISVGILRGNGVHFQLLDVEADHAIHRTLKQIKILLNDCIKLQKKYGLDRRPYTTIDERQGLSDRQRQKRRKEWLWDGAEESDDDKPGKVSWGKRFIWTVHAKEEFGELIGQLEYFIAKLYQLCPTIEERRQALRVLRKYGAEGRSLRIIETAINGHDDRISELGSQLAIEDGSVSSVASTSGSSRSDSSRQSRHRKQSPARLEWHNSRSRMPVYQQHKPTRHSSSRHTLTDMFGDVIGNSRRPISSFR